MESAWFARRVALLIENRSETGRYPRQILWRKNAVQVSLRAVSRDNDFKSSEHTEECYRVSGENHKLYIVSMSACKNFADV